MVCQLTMNIRIRAAFYMIIIYILSFVMNIHRIPSDIYGSFVFGFFATVGLAAAYPEICFPNLR
jgi:hypothetical protein